MISSRPPATFRCVLVTGASGFIGSHLCARLLAEGVEVHAVSRCRRPPGPVRWHRADLCSAAAVERVLDEARPDLIVHLASYVAGTRAVSAVLPMLQANCVAAVNLLSLATERRGLRVILAGSLEAPDDPRPPLSPYAAAKWAAHGYARMFHALYATPVVNARIFMAYGPDQPDYSKLVPHVILSLLRGQTPRLTSGKRQVDWIYIDDIVSGLLAVGQGSDLEGTTCDIGSGTMLSIAHVVRELYSILAPGREPPFGGHPDRPFEIERAADVADTTRRTGWRPQVTLREGLLRTVEHYTRVARGEVVVNALGLPSSRLDPQRP